MNYCIDYRNGSMGNTILAHALFACSQAELDLSKFFSKNGDAHAVRSFNKSNLYAKHLVEYPDDDFQCILTVVCNSWWEILRIKLSYSKWYKNTPTLDNFSDFFSATYNTTDANKLWQDFYQAYRDPLWPDCNTLSDIKNLPDKIQQEIAEVYCVPKSSIVTEQDFVAWLTICYYDLLTANQIDHFPSAKKISLEQYLNGDTSVLQKICSDVFGWRWDPVKSEQFHRAVITTNQQYIQWLDKIKSTVNKLVNNSEITEDFLHWEQALIIAKVCEVIKIEPREIKWDNSGCESLEKSIYLKKFKRTMYGKTI